MRKGVVGVEGRIVVVGPRAVALRRVGNGDFSHMTHRNTTLCAVLKPHEQETTCLTFDSRSHGTADEPHDRHVRCNCRIERETEREKERIHTPVRPAGLTLLQWHVVSRPVFQMHCTITWVMISSDADQS